MNGNWEPVFALGKWDLGHCDLGHCDWDLITGNQRKMSKMVKNWNGINNL